MEKETLWENRLWTLAQLLISAAVLWSASTIWELSKTITRIEERLALAMNQHSASQSVQVSRDAVQDKRLDDLRAEVSELKTLLRVGK